MSRQGLGWAALAAMMLGFAGLFAAYYPPISGVEDEVGFVNQALVWSRGAFSAEGAGYRDLADFSEIGGRHVGTRHPGRSLLAVPFLWLGGVGTVFASGLVLHLLATTLAGAVLSRAGHSPLWAVLVLCHPTLALYSRTVMADEAAGAGLLLAGLAMMSTNAAGAIGSGLAVGLAALMRYQAGLALPVFAVAIGLDRGRPRRARDAALCLAAGGAVGGLIVAYNLAAFHAPAGLVKERGYFSAEFLVPNAIFYASALMVVWPGMLLAPALDRTRLRWAIRGVAGVYLAMFSLYYFHDRAPGRLETAIVGQRLMQVALPLWIVAYAGVLDDRLGGPLRRRLSPLAWASLVAAGCLGLLGLTGYAFARHQRHLDRLVAARAELAALVPDGSLVVYRGALSKLVGVPIGAPSYRLRLLEFHGKPAEDPRALRRDLDRFAGPWYLVDLHKSPGESTSDYARAIIAQYRLEPLPTRSPLLSVYARRAGPPP